MLKPTFSFSVLAPDQSVGSGLYLLTKSCGIFRNLSISSVAESGAGNSIRWRSNLKYGK